MYQECKILFWIFYPITAEPHTVCSVYCQYNDPILQYRLMHIVVNTRKRNR